MASTRLIRPTLCISRVGFQIKGFGLSLLILIIPINTHFYNNIFYADGELRYSVKGGHNTIFENNVFYGNQSSRPSDPQGITSDPLLLNPGTGGSGLDSVDGYRVRLDSPAVGSGKTIPDNGGRDYWGNTVSLTAPCTRGACEYIPQADFDREATSNLLDFSILTAIHANNKETPEIVLAVARTLLEQIPIPGLVFTSFASVLVLLSGGIFWIAFFKRRKAKKLAPGAGKQQIAN